VKKPDKDKRSSLTSAAKKRKVLKDCEQTTAISQHVSSTWSKLEIEQQKQKKTENMDLQLKLSLLFVS
jgi:hypothetical protein